MPQHEGARSGAQTDARIKGWIEAMVGREFVSDWLVVDQPAIDAFADATHDWNFLHTDEAAARAVGLERTVAHGFLTLSLLAPLRMGAGLEPCPGLVMGMNYGLDRVRFLEPVLCGSRIRGRFTTSAITPAGTGRWREELSVVVEIEGHERPAVVATWLAMYLTDAAGG